MTLIKQNLMPTLIILAAAALVVLASLPLAQTDWAAGFRSGSDTEETTQVAQTEDAPGEAEEAAAGGIMVVVPFIKVFIFMGVGGLLTALISGIIKVVSRFTTSKS